MLICAFLLTLFYCYYIGKNVFAWGKTKTWTIDRLVASSPVSVVVAVRNEEKYIEACIKGLLQQNYPANLFEIIIVDDHSKDDTLRSISSFSAPNLNCIELKERMGDSPKKNFKKQALALGVKHAKHDIIITTDGDCKHSPNWLSAMLDFYEQGANVFVAGPVMYETNNSLFNNLQALEVLGLVAITGGQFYLKQAQMCNGANLLFEKKIFEEVIQTEAYQKYASGDDIFLLQHAIKNYDNKVGFVKSLDATVTTFAEENFLSFIYQRQRWTSKMIKKKQFRNLFNDVFNFCLSSLYCVQYNLWFVLFR